MNISFGKRIPISTTQIYNKNTNEFEKATFMNLMGVMNLMWMNWWILVIGGIDTRCLLIFLVR